MAVIRALHKFIYFDELVPRIFRNVAILVSSTTVVAVLGLVTLALTARALGPAGVGILALVEAYIRTVDLLTRLQPTQALIKHGADALEAGDGARFGRLVKLSMLIDLAGGIVAGSIAIALGFWVAPLIGLGPDGYDYILLVALAMFVSFRPTGIAVLRLFDRFGVLALSDAAVALLRLAIAATALALDLGIWAFIAMLFVHSLLDGLVAFGFAVRELVRRGHGGFWRAAGRHAFGENPGFTRLLWNSNFNQILRNATQRFDVLALGALVSPATVGLYQVAKRSGKALLRLGRTFTQVLFPELAKLWGRGDQARFGRLIRRATGLTFALSMALFVPLAFVVPSLVDLAFGAEFSPAVPLIFVQGVAIILNLTGLAFNPALMSMGLDRQLLTITFIGAVAFALAFVPAVMVGSALGAMVCHVLFSLIWFIGCGWLLMRHADRRETTG
ncbi:lipopolysaccharide biosynthesis protein [Jannaschia ovalis]|uniref:Lipopolysaccharide biosynthesis protein n=1 Tax=Jannaschia ovalis TaxID=3038773 RepID=A0ABY8LBK3_9RHOB|nr:lipopolysaccharide biosynthesis protein [Jannaschia sp. GRR-S6-38]WGH78713.1 lipopolysaccharide biosynthesis protein [Jannaschia sp. GRR-S6-38]